MTTNDPKGPELTREDKKPEMKEMARIDQNIAKDTTDPGVDCFNQYFWFDLVGRVWCVWFSRLAWLSSVLFGRFSLVGLAW